VISFEFFPPKTDEGDRNLLEKTLPALLQTRPDYCSVTYGAGGSTREKTLMIVDRIQKQHQLTAVAHLTCVNATREQIGALLEQIRSLGVKNVLALRGDPPVGAQFTPTQGGFEFSNQLVEFIPKAILRAKRASKSIGSISKRKLMRAPISSSRNCFSTIRISTHFATRWCASTE
jgi:methylenetetrahydrofolate reductase (NADPH)